MGHYPFAWGLLRLRERIDLPDWSWRYQDDDALAALHVTALHHLMLCWGQHPLLARLAAPLAQPDRFIRTVTGFATAKLLYDAGNRVGFSPSDSEVRSALHHRRRRTAVTRTACAGRHCNGGSGRGAAPKS